MGRSIGFDHVSATSTSSVWDLNQVGERIQDGEWVQIGPGQIDILVVGGGGSGTVSGSSAPAYPSFPGNYGGGGGAGGFVVSSNVSVEAFKNYEIIIGAGGTSGDNGGDSIFRDS